ncbi:hypothetical protein QLX08_007996 [Tetragonisca angustula]|uniref:Uncharacterized protein n=1 Tax=Tetragonisca angustula TaxID=166442 RepID=A0AAW0ZMI4_9HYME
MQSFQMLKFLLESRGPKLSHVELSETDNECTGRSSITKDEDRPAISGGSICDGKRGSGYLHREKGLFNSDRVT